MPTDGVINTIHYMTRCGISPCSDHLLANNNFGLMVKSYMKSQRMKEKEAARREQCAITSAEKSHFMSAISID